MAKKTRPLTSKQRPEHSRFKAACLLAVGLAISTSASAYSTGPHLYQNSPENKLKATAAKLEHLASNARTEQAQWHLAMSYLSANQCAQYFSESTINEHLKRTTVRRLESLAGSQFSFQPISKQDLGHICTEIAARGFAMVCRPLPTVIPRDFEVSIAPLGVACGLTQTDNRTNIYRLKSNEIQILETEEHLEISPFPGADDQFQVRFDQTKEQSSALVRIKVKSTGQVFPMQINLKPIAPQ